MIVPQYWAEGRVQHKTREKQVTVRRFGWSDTSLEDAQTQADARAREALDRILAGDNLQRREPKVAYNGAEGVPIREEIVARHGEAIITRNLYGALCLNTPNVLFVDVDHENDAPFRLSCTVHVIFLVVAVAWGISQRSFPLTMLALVLTITLSHGVAVGLFRLYELCLGGPTILASRRIRRFSARHPDWHLRVYDTPAGRRILVMHDVFDPHEDRVTRCFRELGADRVYVNMCVRQNCFRARVTAKPWNIGINVHMRPRPGVWPINPDRLPLRQRWIREYEPIAACFAACRFVEQLGSAVTHKTTEAVCRLHDDLAQAHSGLPLA